MKKIVLIALIAPIWAHGQKKEFETTARITDVTVYTSSAEINYEKEISLQKGKNSIVFTDLTPFISENSVNVSVSSPAVNIITVTERINYAKEKKNINDWVIFLQDSISIITRELGLLKCSRDASLAEKDLLFKNEAIGGLSTHGVLVSEIEKASAFFSKRYLQLSRELFFLNEKETDLSERIKKYQKQLKELETVTVQTTSEIKVTVNCAADEKVLFKFKFLTTKAGWAPVYDFKYNGETKPLEFIFRANVFNASGIPWQDVSFKLSTADPIQGFALPSLNRDESEEKTITDTKFKQIEVVNAITEYTITHQYSIPSDAKPYLIDVKNFTMPATYNYLLIPKLDPFGFLMAKIPDWNKYNLIPGTTNIYNAGTYMGKTFLDTYAENDTLSLYLGKDKNIQAIRNEKAILHSRFLVSNYSLEETFTDISVKNTFSGTLPVEIMDQVPLYTKEDKEKLSVFNIGNGLFDKTEGLITWSFILKPGETININYKYEIKAPKTHGHSFRRKKYRVIACPSF